MVVESQLQETGDDREDRRINKTHLAVHCLFLLFLHDVGIISANQCCQRAPWDFQCPNICIQNVFSWYIFRVMIWAIEACSVCVTMSDWSENQTYLGYNHAAASKTLPRKAPFKKCLVYSGIGQIVFGQAFTHTHAPLRLFWPNSPEERLPPPPQTGHAHPTEGVFQKGASLWVFQ